MTSQRSDMVSAQVVLKPASGAKLEDSEAITTKNLQRYAPDPGAVAEVTEWFRERSFDVGSFLGNSFSITAPVSHFEKTFDIKLSARGGKGIQFETGAGTRAHELPPAKLPRAISRHLAAVTFTPPPDFGPSNP